MLKRYFTLLVMGVLFCTLSLQAIEAEIETEAPAKVYQQKKTAVSIDALVAKYQEASEEEAYKIMNQIKQQIALMSQQRQANAIGKVRQTVEKKSSVQKKRARKQKKRNQKVRSTKHSKKYPKKAHKPKKKVQKKYKKKKKNRALESISQTSFTEAHPDPMSVMNGISEGSGMDSDGGISSGGGMGGFGGGGSGMGGMGGF